jgi:hypothetical protein
MNKTIRNCACYCFIVGILGVSEATLLLHLASGLGWEWWQKLPFALVLLGSGWNFFMGLRLACGEARPEEVGQILVLRAVFFGPVPAPAELRTWGVPESRLPWTFWCLGGGCLIWGAAYLGVGVLLLMAGPVLAFLAPCPPWAKGVLAVLCLNVGGALAAFGASHMGRAWCAVGQARAL